MVNLERKLGHTTEVDVESVGKVSVFKKITRGKGLVVVAVLLLLGGYYMFTGVTETVAVSGEEAVAEAKELAEVITALEKHMVIPEGEEPVLAEVQDAEALIAQQAFFTGAINGDKLVLFPTSMKAVLYSPSRDRIVNTGPIEQTQQ